MIKKTPNYIQYIVKNVFFLFLFNVLFRIIFYNFSMELEGLSANEIRKSFLLGIRFDLKLAILSFFPLALLILIVNYRFFTKRIYKKINTIYLTATYLVILLFYVVDFGHYEYLAMRVDASALRFLSNLKISSQVLFESYPVYKGFFGLVVFGFISFKFANHLYKKTTQRKRCALRK